ncbi:aluminum-activated malate transporter 1-like [Miscanthus floridulus]|uniref:aluminum-activated malate transporter 1-like n=1 Tax=Miscanthus floridulus TaxID=154761 RepID=UPI003459E253
MEIDQMESGANGAGGGGFRLARCWELLCSAAGMLRGKVVGFARKLGRIARDDPRRVAHSFKVGLALTLVSVLYYVRPLFNNWGVSTMWAVLTTVVVMEYTVGGTLCKGLNRAFGTLVAGFIAVGAHKVAYLCGDKAEPVLLAIFVFLLSSAATFSRFIPEVKARYDYGVTIFILTFSLVAVSSYRVDELIRLAHQRFSTIVVGVATCLCTTIFVFPVWAGEDLHKLAIGNLNKLAEFFEGIESECFRENATFENLEAKPFLQVYKTVLNSKATEDSLCNFAKWEPCHGKFKFRHPWSHYQKLGALSRQCASSMEALASYVITLTRTEYPEAHPELCLEVRTACRQMSLHSAKALRELSAAMRMVTLPSQANVHMSAAIKAAKGLRDELAEDADLVQAMHVAVIASLLSDLVTKTKQITESVDILARLARFKNPENTQKDVGINVVS